jgi:hypothetical protein
VCIFLSKEDRHYKTKPYEPCAHGGPLDAQVCAQETVPNFTDGWAVPEEAMREVPKSDGNLTALFVDNSDAAMDGILQNFMSD